MPFSNDIETDESWLNSTQYRSTNFLSDLFKNYRDCAFVDEGNDVIFFKGRDGTCKQSTRQPKLAKESGEVSDSGVDVGRVEEKQQ